MINKFRMLFAKI